MASGAGNRDTKKALGTGKARRSAETKKRLKGSCCKKGTTLGPRTTVQTENRIPIPDPDPLTRPLYLQTLPFSPDV